MTRKKRAPIYGPKIKEAILAQLAEGKSLREVCKPDGMPSSALVCQWARDDADFAERYARARETGFSLLAEELLEIADDGSNDTYRDKDGNEHTDHDVIARSRLRVDTRKWMLSKMLPKIYGEKVTQEHTGKDGQPVAIAVTHTIIDPSAAN